MGIGYSSLVDSTFVLFHLQIDGFLRTVADGDVELVTHFSANSCTVKFLCKRLGQRFSEDWFKNTLAQCLQKLKALLLASHYLYLSTRFGTLRRLAEGGRWKLELTFRETTPKHSCCFFLGKFRMTGKREERRKEIEEREEKDYTTLCFYIGEFLNDNNYNSNKNWKRFAPHSFQRTIIWAGLFFKNQAIRCISVIWVFNDMWIHGN